MLFNTFDFAIFLPIVLILYWFVFNKNIWTQNALIVVASYVFYGWWDWRFLLLIFFSTFLDFTIGKKLSVESSSYKRKVLLWLSIIVNIGFLGFFKYYNFFVESFTDAFTFFGGQIKPNTLNIILPVGISFYTFQTLSYTIDIYRNKLTPAKDFISFAAFVSFFPQLVAGPIERATNLLPQFYRKRTFNSENAILGINQIIWGLFKKVVIADNCAQYANDIFNNYQDYSSTTLLLGVLYFSFQIYGDFSGYSDIAIGTARLFDFKLMTNFKYPYFSRDIAEFWRRWHISLSTWFRDYVYIPLGGSKSSLVKKIRNVFVIFLVSGFWHGANWTFLIWGGVNAVFFIPLMLLNKNRKNTDVVAEHTFLPSFKEIAKMLYTFLIVMFGWIFFRAQNLTHAYDYIVRIIYAFSLQIEMMHIERYTVEILPLIAILLAFEWFSRKEEFPLFAKKYSFLKVSIVLGMILIWGNFSSIQEFIYFQF